MTSHVRRLNDEAESFKLTFIIAIKFYGLRLKAVKIIV